MDHVKISEEINKEKKYEDSTFSEVLMNHS